MLVAVGSSCGGSSSEAPGGASDSGRGFDAAPDAQPDASKADAGTDAPEGSVAGACIGNVSVDFASLAPYLVDMSSSCGSAAASNGALTLSRNGSCSSGDGKDALASLDMTRWQLCGDFDVQVTFDLTDFPIPTSSSRYAVLRAYSPSSNDGIALERYDTSTPSSKVPSTQDYKGWTTDPDDGVARFVPTNDVTGLMRLTRSGTTVTSYAFAGDDAGGGGTWAPIDTGTLTSAPPWSLQLYSGYGGTGDPANQTVTFSHLTIASSASGR